MDEITLSFDKESKQEIDKKVVFDEIIAGKTERRNLYIKNNTNYKINLEIKIKGENVTLIDNIYEINPGETKEIGFKFNAKLTTMKPIKAELKIKIEYLMT